MKSIEELKNFFDTELTNDLTPLEEERKRIAKKAIRINILFGILLIIPIVLFFLIYQFSFFILFIIIFIWAFVFNKITKNYKSDFKKEVIARVIKFIDNNLIYNPDQCISYDNYMKSKLFLRSTDRYRGDDYVSGKIDKTNIEFSELHTEYKTVTRTKSGTQTHWHTIFKGIFFIADFNKKFKGQTFVLPDIAQRTFGNYLGNIFQSMNKLKGELIKMEDPLFEKYFVVYGDDQIEARYILSTNLLKRIVDYKIKTGKQIYLSFIENKVFIAISYTKSLFEPRLFKSLFDFGMIQEYYEDFKLTINFVDELKLNIRIWG